MGKKARERRERMVWAKNQMVRQSVIADARLIDLINIDGSKEIPNMPVVIADEVQESINQSTEHWWTYTDFKSVSPPFNEFFIEAKTVVSPEFTSLRGVRFTVYDKDSLDKLPYQDSYAYSVAPPVFKEQEAAARWVCTLRGYRADITRRVLIMEIPVLGVAFISAKGELIHEGDQTAFVRFPAFVNPEQIEEWNRKLVTPHTIEEYSGMLSVQMACHLLALQLMNCRNVKLVDNEPDAEKSRVYERHFGQPLTKYKTLAIKPIGKRYESDDEQPYQGIMPLHIRRGHFATYTEDAPLFGKYTGTFWRPATVVGEQDNGIVVKDYEVKP